MISGRADFEAKSVHDPSVLVISSSRLQWISISWKVGENTDGWAPSQNFCFGRSAVWAGEFAFLTSSQVMLRLVQGPHFENHSLNLREHEDSKSKREKSEKTLPDPSGFEKGKKASISQDWTKSFHVISVGVLEFQPHSRAPSTESMSTYKSN